MNTLTTIGYLALLLAGIVLEILAYLPNSRLRPVRAYASAVLRNPITRWTMLVLWWWVGWHFFVR